MVVMEMKLLLRRVVLLRTGLGDLRLPVGAHVGPDAPRGGIHASEPAVAVLHRAQDVDD